MKEHSEQLDEIEQVLQQLIKRIGTVDEKLSSHTNTSPPEQAINEHWSDELAGLKQDFNKRVETVLDSIKGLSEQVTGIPKQLPVAHHHHFDLRSKGVIIGTVILLVVTALSVGLSLSLWSENRSLHGQGVKYELIGLVSPSVVRWADSVYTKDPAGVLLATKQALERQQAAADSRKGTAHKKTKRKH